MTDKMMLITLLEKWDVEYEEFNTDTYSMITIEPDRTNPASKVVGYSGFSTEFKFNLDGSFVDIGIWE